MLALLAEGATNRQIGAALFMAEKTASVHVSRILAKLGVQQPHRRRRRSRTGSSLARTLRHVTRAFRPNRSRTTGR